MVPVITLEMLRRRNVPVTDVLNIYTDQAAGLQFLGCFDWNDVIASNGAGSQTVSQRVCANAQYDRAPMLGVPHSTTTVPTQQPMVKR